MEQKILFPEKELANFRLQGDTLADKTVEKLFELGYNPMSNTAYQDFQFNEQALPKDFPPVLQHYFQQITDSPLDHNLIDSGVNFFLQHAQPIMLCLGLYALPYCYAAANGSKVLASSKRILEKPENRLQETADFVLDLHAPNAFKKGGKALISIAKVRLMHAAIRYHLLNSGKWDNAWGHPINQMDMAGTNLSFSLIVLRGLKKLGYNIPLRDAENYLLFWNQIGSLLGLDLELMPKNNKEAFVLELKIRHSQFEYSPEGEALTKALLRYIDMQETPFPIKGSVIAKYFLGEEMVKILNIPSNGQSHEIGIPLKLLNTIQFQLKGKNTSYQAILKSFNQQRGKSRSEGNFNFLMSLSD